LTALLFWDTVKLAFKDFFMGRAKKNQVCFPSYKVKPETIDSLKQTALESGYIYGNGAAMGEFLDKLATLDRDLLKILIKKT
jgi:hypothetical protein